jgi:hypothetical protein
MKKNKGEKIWSGKFVINKYLKIKDIKRREMDGKSNLEMWKLWLYP